LINGPRAPIHQHRIPNSRRPYPPLIKRRRCEKIPLFPFNIHGGWRRSVLFAYSSLKPERPSKKTNHIIYLHLREQKRLFKKMQRKP